MRGRARCAFWRPVCRLWRFRHVCGGFFHGAAQGLNSRAQIFEQVVRIGVVALLIDSAVPQGIGTACAAVVVGNTVMRLRAGYIWNGATGVS